MKIKITSTTGMMIITTLSEVVAG